MIPISIQQWNKPKAGDPEVSFVTDRQKDDLWTALKANFTLPEEEHPEKLVIEQKVKTHALKKMAELFRRWKNELKTTFVDKEKTPTFTGRFEKIREQWPAFVAHKTSEKSKKMSAINKLNAAKKKHHHCTGSGGYHKARLLWEKAEKDLLDKGIVPRTLNWPERARNWFFGVGGTLHPETGKCFWTNEQLRVPITKLEELIAQTEAGTFVPDRENDELTMALGNPEHPGRTRGTAGSLPWKHGFPDAGGYKSRERKRKQEQSEIQNLHARVQALEERHRADEATLEATPPSQRRSSVASTEVIAQPDLMASRYPVDEITESQECHLKKQLMQFKPTVAIGHVAPPRPNGTFHCLPIPQGYAVVMVDEIMEVYEEIELDYPTGEGENLLQNSLRTSCLWPKEFIKLLN